MNWEHIKADWSQVKGKVKAKWGKLTDDDLKTIEREVGPARREDPAPLRL